MAPRGSPGEFDSTPEVRGYEEGHLGCPSCLRRDVQSTRGPYGDSSDTPTSHASPPPVPSSYDGFGESKNSVSSGRWVGVVGSRGH